MTLRNTMPDPPRLVGDLAVWLIIVAEMLAFCILFLSYALRAPRMWRFSMLRKVRWICTPVPSTLCC